MSEILDYTPYMKIEYKVYVDVNEIQLKDGRFFPLSFIWEDGDRYEINRISDVRRAASLKAGSTGIRYTVRVRQKETFMFLEEDGETHKWFMVCQ